jgi:hypothetical protein
MLLDGVQLVGEYLWETFRGIYPSCFHIQGYFEVSVCKMFFAALLHC